MNQFASERLANASETTVPISTGTRAGLILAAWVSTLLLSKLPLVIARVLLGADIPWIAQAWVGMAGLFIVISYVWPLIRPLRGYFAVMGVMLLVTTVLDPLARQTPAWQSLTAGGSRMTGVFADRILLVAASLIVLAVVFLLGKSRREVFLTPGQMDAPVTGLALLGGRRVSWSVYGTVVSLLLGGLFFAFLASQNPRLLPNLGAALPWLPLILLSAALNAFGEESIFRAAPLSTLLPAVGANHAVWLTAAWFGLGHFYGGFPSGLVGLVYTGFLALLLGKAMLDTRGMGWPWIIHFVIDTLIYLSIAIAAGL
jgi:membrane protease YdiL (CAAX protease family)